MADLNDHRHLLCDLAIEERNTIRNTIDDMDADDQADMIERFNQLGEAFDLEAWSDQDVDPIS